MTIDVRFLGPLELVLDGRLVHVGSARQRTLLIALALELGGTVTSSRLIDLLWGDDPPDNALGNLHSYVSRLRRLAGRELISFDGNGYRLAGREVGTDLQRAMALIARARSLSAEHPERAVDLAGQALAYWRGDVLQDTPDSLAFAPDRARLEELRMAIAEERAELLLVLGRAREAIPDLEWLAGEHVLREPAHILLLRALAAVGRTADAVRVAARFRRQLADETGLEPSPELRQWEQRVLAGEAVAPTASARGRATRRAETAVRKLPREGRFFGRRWELQELDARMRTVQVLTVTGPGGVGKTRLVAECLALADLDESTYIVELAGIDASSVVAALGAAVGVLGGEGSLDDAVVEFLSVETALIVLDNCEHVADAVTRLVSRLADECPTVRVLSTSRRRLGVRGERVLPVQPLPLRDSRGGDGEDAVALFLDRADRLEPGPETIDSITTICRRLDGLPLAIELAAHRAATFGTAGLLDRLDRVLDLLERSTAPNERRHATLRAVVDWSYSLLGTDAQCVLDALAVFESGMSLDDAETVARAVTTARVASIIAELVDASLLVADAGDGAVRYRMLEIVRQHGWEQLDRRGLEAVVRATHGRAMVARAEQLRGLSAGPHEWRAVDLLRSERDNLRAALAWLALHDPPAAGPLAVGLAKLVLYRPDLEVLTALTAAIEDWEPPRPVDVGVAGAAARAALLRGELDACRGRAELALDAPDDSAGAVLAAHSLAVWHLYAGALDQADHWFRCSAEVRGADQAAQMDALGGRSLAACFAGDFGRAADLAEELRVTADLADSTTYRAFASYVLGEVAAPRADADALPLLEEAVDLAEEAGAHFVTGLASVALVAALVRLGRDDEAIDRIGPLLELWRRAGTWTQQWTTLRQLADLVADRDPGTALLLLEAAERDPAAPAVVGAARERLDGLRRQLTARLDAAGVSRASRLAATLTRAQVLQLALTAVSPGWATT